MNNSPIRNLLFDLGNVIIDIRPEHTFQLMSDRFGLRIDAFLADERIWQILNSYEIGAIDEMVVCEQLQAHSGIDIQTEQFRELYESMILGIPPQKIELLKSLRRSYRLLLLSNTNYIHMNMIHAYVQREYGLDSLDVLFDKAFYSHLMGLRKPDPEIYRQVAAQAGIKAEETLYIDDVAEYTRAASEIGYRTIHLKQPDQLVWELQAYPGIELPE